MLAIAPSLIRSIFDVESTNVFLVLSSYCQYFLLHFRLQPVRSLPVTNDAGSALDFRIFPTGNVLIRTNCNNKVHSLKFSMVNSSLILDFALQEVARSC